MAGQFDHFNFLLAFLFTLEVAADTSSPSVEFAILNQVFCVARDFWTYNAASVSCTYSNEQFGCRVCDFLAISEGGIGQWWGTEEIL